MTREEFGVVMYYIGSGCGKHLPDDGSDRPQPIDIYYDLLKTHSVEALQYAARQALLHSTYSAFPQIGTLHEYAVDFERNKRRLELREEQKLMYGTPPLGPPRPEVAKILKGITKNVG